MTRGCALARAQPRRAHLSSVQYIAVESGASLQKEGGVPCTPPAPSMHTERAQSHPWWYPHVRPATDGVAFV